VRENRTQGSVRGQSGNRLVYLDCGSKSIWIFKNQYLKPPLSIKTATINKFQQEFAKEHSMEIEPQIKKQYSKIFKFSDWQTYKLMADYYFETAAKILKKDIKIDEIFQLMGRNIQKRLFIGIGTELLLKALFLKNSYCINRVKRNKTPNLKRPTLFTAIQDNKILDPANTYTLSVLIDNISEIITTTDQKMLEKGLKIAKVFRNKEGHVAVLWHKPDRQNYTDIENSIIEIYEKGFDESLDFQISFLDGEIAKFQIK
jgi:hypothetical protein